MAREGDKIGKLLEIQQRAIFRTTRWWLGAIERLQSGDLDPKHWHEAQAKYFEAIREDLGMALDQLPLEARGVKKPSEAKDGK